MQYVLSARIRSIRRSSLRLWILLGMKSPFHLRPEGFILKCFDITIRFSASMKSEREWEPFCDFLLSCSLSSLSFSKQDGDWVHFYSTYGFVIGFSFLDQLYYSSRALGLIHPPTVKKLSWGLSRVRSLCCGDQLQFLFFACWQSVMAFFAFNYISPPILFFFLSCFCCLLRCVCFGFLSFSVMYVCLDVTDQLKRGYWQGTGGDHILLFLGKAWRIVGYSHKTMVSPSVGFPRCWNAVCGFDGGGISEGPLPGWCRVEMLRFWVVVT